MPTPETYMFDDGPLSHFAEAGWLGFLRVFVGDGTAYVPETVHAELLAGVDSNPHLRGVLDADWLPRLALTSAEDHAALRTFTRRLLGDDNRKNLGECGVLAAAKTRNAIAVIDDGDARRAAEDEGVRYTTTLSILLGFVRKKDVSMKVASDLADSLMRTEYFLPFGPGGFATWAMMNGLYDEEEENGDDTEGEDE